jgi:hypothetical protein
LISISQLPLLLGFTMLLGLKPSHAHDLIACLTGVSFLTVAVITIF